jgi:hypothetical protein
VTQLVTLTPVDPPGTPLSIELSDRPQVAGGVGGWEPIDRPRLRQITEWAGTPLRTLVLPVVLSSLPADGRDGGDIEDRMSTVEACSQRTAATGQPSVFTIRGPVRHLGLRYVVQAVEWDNETFQADKQGRRVQQFGTVSLLEYASAAVLVTRNPVKKARGKKGKKGGKRARTVTVRQGDTLQKIAARELGAAKRWKEIAALNGIRDGDAVRPGRVLKLP